ncbi:aromatic amino acid lyase [Nocardioides convexus]|uniref:aromatic amino acid lyase n=1 Tax=Nocardioides convexus TaxID=2712224 RepID=UPI002418AADA|nr:aromatic amino acid lyase [Nocardioides convexus]
MVTVGTGAVSFEDVVAVARRGAGVVLGEDALAAIDKARAVIEDLAASPTPHYGVSTGFGALATRHIAPEPARPAPALAGALARRRQRSRGRA